MSNPRYVLLPEFKDLGSNNLKLRDILVYATIRSFYNQKDKYCYPSYRTIAKQADLSIGYVAKAVKRLEKAKLIEVWRYGKARFKNLYKFPDECCKRTIPLEILHLDELSSYEKSAFLILLEHMDADYSTTKRVADISKSSGIPERNLKSLLKAILLKGYLREYFIKQQCEVKKVISVSPDLLKWFPKQIRTIDAKPISEEEQIEDILRMATGQRFTHKK